MQELELGTLTHQVCEIARQVGAFIRDERKGFDRSRVEEKGSHDYVSYVDKESEGQLVGMLNQLVPQAGFMAEEGSGSYDNEEYCWIVDPLDGTTNFIHDNAPYCVSIALARRDEVILGVVYEICRDECFSSYEGGISELNGKPINVSAVDKMDDSVFIVGLPYDWKSYKPMAQKLLERLYGNVSSIRMMGAAAAELCYVAAGRFEGRIEAMLKPWDVAAGSIILKNAGGKITDFTGGEGYLTGQEVVATNTLMHEALLNVINN